VRFLWPPFLPFPDKAEFTWGLLREWGSTCERCLALLQQSPDWPGPEMEEGCIHKNSVEILNAMKKGCQLCGVFCNALLALGGWKAPDIPAGESSQSKLSGETLEMNPQYSVRLDGRQTLELLDTGEFNPDSEDDPRCLSYGISIRLGGYVGPTYMHLPTY
jgi:hypothetical protein